jgi:hypothetical protein
MSRAAKALILLLMGSQRLAADGDLLSRIRRHMRDYLAQLPDYTCRLTIERSARRSSRTPFHLADRLRLEIGYSGGREYYAWPGDGRFENGIEDLLPERGLVSNGSYALHMRKLFQTNDAQFSEVREDSCERTACLRVDFLVPAVRSGYSLSAGGAAAPVALRGSAWFGRETLDITRLEVRVEDTPESVRVARTRELTTYSKTRIGDADFVLPASSELLLRDRDGSERRNASRFDGCRKYTGSATIFYGAGTDAAEARAAPPRAGRVAPGTRISTVLDRGIPEDAAVGDEFTGSGGVVGRITDMRRAGNRWSLELTLVKVGADSARGSLRRTLSLPVPAGASFTWRVE